MLHSTNGRSRLFMRCAARRLAVLSTAALAALLPLAASAQPIPPSEPARTRQPRRGAASRARPTPATSNSEMAGLDRPADRSAGRARRSGAGGRFAGHPGEEICALDYVPAEEVLVAAYDGAHHPFDQGRPHRSQTGAVQTRDSGFGTRRRIPTSASWSTTTGRVLPMTGNRQELLFWSSTTALVNPDVGPRATHPALFPSCFTCRIRRLQIGPDGKAWLSTVRTARAAASGVSRTSRRTGRVRQPDRQLRARRCLFSVSRQLLRRQQPRWLVGKDLRRLDRGSLQRQPEPRDFRHLPGCIRYHRGKDFSAGHGIR